MTYIPEKRYSGSAQLGREGGGDAEGERQGYGYSERWSSKRGGHGILTGSDSPAPRYQSLKLLVKRHRITYKYSTYVFTEMIIAMTSVFNELREPVEHLPLSPQDFQVLMVVFDQPLHGYGIVKASTDESGRAVLDLGSLYRIISRLIKKGLLEDVTAEQADSKRQRRYYRATQLGRRVTRAEAVRLRELLASQQAELLWQKP